MSSAPSATASGASATRPGTVRIGAALLLGTVGYTTPFIAGSAVLLPARISDINDDDKVQLLAVVTAAASIVALLANVIFGALSDRTRTRYGARTPWIVGGSIAAAALITTTGLIDRFIPTLLLWCAAVGVLNGPAAALNAILPDRVAVERRATVSALLGLGILLGGATGSVVGAVFVDRQEVGFAVASAIFIAASVGAVLLAPDTDNREVPLAASTVGTAPVKVLREAFTFPQHAPDFYWALVGRLALVLGYFMVNGYQLYILTDHVGLSEDRAAEVVGINSLLFLGTAIIGVLLAGPTSDRWQRRKPFVIGASVVAVLAVIAPLLSATTTAMHIFAVIGGIAFGAYFSVDAAMVSEVLPDDESRARDLGILNMANTGGQVLAPAASAGLVAIGVGFAPVFLGAMAVCALGAALVAPIKSVR